MRAGRRNVGVAQAPGLPDISHVHDNYVCNEHPGIKLRGLLARLFHNLHLGQKEEKSILLIKPYGNHHGHWRFFRAKPSPVWIPRYQGESTIS